MTLETRAVLAALLLLCGASVRAAPPGEVPPTLRWQASGSLAWEPVPGATSYDVYLGQLPSAGDHRCRLAGLLDPAAQLDDRPGPGSLLYVLVSAVNGEGESPLGADSRGAARANDAPCDADADGLLDGEDNCPLDPNPGQEDQDEDGEGDRCDPQTHDFEDDLPGARAAGTRQVGGPDDSFLVRDLGGELGVGYDERAPGVHDVFERLPAPAPFHDTTVFIDLEDVAETASFELWSEGAWGWNAGSGLIVQVQPSGQVFFYDRYGRAVPQTPGPLLPPSGRLRLRLRKQPGTVSRLHVDGWLAGAWQEDLDVFTVADDRRHRGLSVVIANYIGGRRGLKRITINHELPTAEFLLLKHPSWSDDWKLFQRDAAGQASIPVRFFYRLAGPGRAEAALVDASTRLVLPGHDFGDHVLPLAAAAGRHVEMLVPGVPTGGNYDLVLRVLRDEDGSAVGGGFLSNLAVGDVHVCGGQSNMSGYSGGLAGAETPVDEIHLFHADGTWKRASEPMDDGTDQVDLVSAESPGHSLMLSFAKRLHEATGVPVGIIPGPLGGTNLFAQWQRNPADPDDRGTLYGSLLHRVRSQGYGAPPTAFLWFQGESDVLAGRSLAQYQADLEQLLAWMREDLAHPGLYFLNAQLGTYAAADLGPWLGVQEAQRRQALADPRSALIPTVDEPRSDAIHFNVTGYQDIGRRFADAARELIFSEPLDAAPALLEARVTGLRRQVEIEFDAPVSGGAPELFRVSDDAGPLGLRGLAVAGGRVTLDLDRDLGTGGLVSYGHATDPAAAWLLDAQGDALACFAEFSIGG